jgi:hypothetical protein
MIIITNLSASVKGKEKRRVKVRLSFGQSFPLAGYPPKKTHSQSHAPRCLLLLDALLMHRDTMQNKATPCAMGQGHIDP